MGMLDDAFKKDPVRKQPSSPFRFGVEVPRAKGSRSARSRKPASRKITADTNLPSGRRTKTVAVVPYGTGRQGTMKGIPLVTPAPKQSTSLTIFSPKQVTVRSQPQKQRTSGGNGFNFGNPHGTGTSRTSGSGSSKPMGSSQPLGSSSGISAGKRHKGKVVGGIKTPKRGGGIRQAVSSAVGRGRVKTRRVAQKVRGGVVASFNEPAKQKERKAIVKQVKKGIHKTLFKGKHRLI